MFTFLFMSQCNDYPYELHDFKTNQHPSKAFTSILSCVKSCLPNFGPSGSAITSKGTPSGSSFLANFCSNCFS